MQFLVNGFSFEGPEVPILLQILHGANASELVPAGSIYPLGGNMSVEISMPAGVAGGPVSLHASFCVRGYRLTRPSLPFSKHPMHLHGHAFHVVRSAGNLDYNYDDPVIRDVVSMGEPGDNVTIRFFTDNPGPWFFHCHIDWHLEQ